MARNFPPEWHPQDAILMAWPHKNTDWLYILPEVTACFSNIANEILNYQHLIIVTPDPEEVNRTFLNHTHSERLHCFKIPTNDTWARDFGPISVLTDGNPLLLNFKFNAWGMKFPANLDNQINRRLNKAHAFRAPMENHLDFVLEGGSIDSDGNGAVLTTSQCLLSENRNENTPKQTLEGLLCNYLGARKILFLRNGALSGDDTDAHIDTLARFAPGNTILYTACYDMNDSHFISLQAMEQELKSFTNADGNPYNLIPLPLPDPIFDSEGNRLPATYANFLVINGAVIVPTYNQPHLDIEALAIIGKAFPDRKIIGIDCTPLIQQHGSLHCVTMQLIKNSAQL